MIDLLGNYKDIDDNIGKFGLGSSSVGRVRLVCL